MHLTRLQTAPLSKLIHQLSAGYQNQGGGLGNLISPGRLLLKNNYFSVVAAASQV